MASAEKHPLLHRGWVRVLLVLLALGLVVFLGALAWALPSPAPRLSPQIASRQPDVAHGAYLARVGDCTACHTKPGGAAFGGGVAFKTPVGVVYSTNISSDRTHGMGGYSLPQFMRLMREGVAADGRRIYPAMPYTAFAKTSDADLQDLHAYFTKAVAPVDTPQRRSGILWPLSIRWPLAFWNKAFHDDSRFAPVSSQNAQLNRGAYLVESLGHCGTCHTPRGWAMQEMATTNNSSSLYLSGSALDGQSPSNLRGNPWTGLGRWSPDEIVELLKTGRTAHGVVAGQMTEVIANSTQYMSDDDLRAMAVYLKSLSPAPNQVGGYAHSDATLNAFMSGHVTSRGQQIYMDSCSACHRWNGEGADRAIPSLAGDAAVLHKNPDSMVSTILAGQRLPSTQGAPSPLAMPAYDWRYSDAEIADLSTFLRSAWGNHAPAVAEKDVKRIRKQAVDPQRERR